MSNDTKTNPNDTRRNPKPRPILANAREIVGGRLYPYTKFRRFGQFGKHQYPIFAIEAQAHRDVVFAIKNGKAFQPKVTFGIGNEKKYRGLTAALKAAGW